jgi:TonB family protein
MFSLTMYPILKDDVSKQAAEVNSDFARARNVEEGFLRHFGFHESPFGVTPNPAFLFFSSMHSAALRSMIHSIESNLGFTVLLGDPGTGKTTLLFHLLSQYRESARTAFIFHTQCKPCNLLRYIAAEFELPGRNIDEVCLHQRLKQMLVEEARAGHKVIIVIDEAQNLHHSSLEAIRLLSDFETASAKLLHVVLAGSSRLGETLLARQMPQLSQRVSTVCRLGALTGEEVEAYIISRMRVAGAKVTEGLFSPDSIAEIANRSGGVPRVVNSICYRALSLAYVRGERRVSKEFIEQAVQSLDLSESGGRTLAPADPFPEDPRQGARAQFFNSVSHHPDRAPRGFERSVDASGAPVDERTKPGKGKSLAAEKTGDEGLYPPVPSILIPPTRPDQNPPSGAGRLNPTINRETRVRRQLGSGSANSKKDHFAVLVGSLIVLVLGSMLGLNAFRAKFSRAAQNPAENRPASSSVAGKPRGADSSPAPTAQTSPSFTANQTTKAEAADQKPTGAATSSATRPIIETLPDAALPSRIERRPVDQAESAAPDIVLDVSRNSGPPGLSVPASLPSLAVPPNPATPAATMQPIKIVEPKYPEIAKLRHIEGQVLLEVEVNSNGQVQKVRTLSGNPMLREAAEQAARQWGYPPTPFEQRSFPSVMRVKFNFRLNQASER